MTNKVWPNRILINAMRESDFKLGQDQFIPYCYKCKHNHVFKDVMEDRKCEHPFCLCTQRPWSKKEYDQVPHDPNCKCNNLGLKKVRKAHQKSCPLYIEQKPKYCGCVLIFGSQRIQCLKKTSHRWDHSWHIEKTGVTIYWTGPDHKLAKRRGESLEKKVDVN